MSLITIDFAEEKEEVDFAIVYGPMPNTKWALRLIIYCREVRFFFWVSCRELR